MSTTGKGAALDKVTVPGAGGTTDDPFHVDLDGKIVWKGATTGVVRNGTYRVTAFGASIANGDVKNDKGERSWSGTEDVGARLENVPVVGKVTKWINPTFTVKVDYRVASATTACAGTVVLKVGDDPAFTPLWVLSIVLFFLAFWMLFWPRAFFGG